jgi:hypothetical protein
MFICAMRKEIEKPWQRTGILLVKNKDLNHFSFFDLVVTHVYSSIQFAKQFWEI